MNTPAIRQPITIANAVNTSLAERRREASTARPLKVPSQLLSDWLARRKTPTWEQGWRNSSFYRTDRQELRRLTSVAVTEGQHHSEKGPAISNALVAGPFSLTVIWRSTNGEYSSFAPRIAMLLMSRGKTNFVSDSEVYGNYMSPRQLFGEGFVRAETLYAELILACNQVKIGYNL